MASRWNAVSESVATRPQRKMGIKVGGEHLAPQTAHIFAQSFPQNPVLTYILTPHYPTLRERKAFLPRYFRVLCLAATLNHGIFVLAGEEERLQPLQPLHLQGDREKDMGREKEIVPECAALLLPPGAKVDSLRTLWKSGFLGLAWDIGFRGMWRMGRVQGAMRGMVGDAVGGDPYTTPMAVPPSLPSPPSSSLIPWLIPSSLTSPNKSTSNNKERKEEKRYYHLHQLATRPSSRGKGLSQAVLEKVKEIVEREGRRKPVWLEATSEEGRRVYEKAGWRVVGIGRVGEGLVGGGGEREEEGEGVRVWGMVWWPVERVEMG